MRRVSLLFGGDFSPHGSFELIAKNQGSRLFGDACQIIEQADFSLLNLECPHTTSMRPTRKAGPNLKADMDCLNAVASAGFNAVGLANNHIMDFGKEGLFDTLEACNHYGIQYFGAGGSESEACEPLQFNCNGIKIAVIGVAEREFGEAEQTHAGFAVVEALETYQKVLFEKTRNDIVIIFLHGGNEFFPYPRPRYRKLCRFLVDAGADAVIGHHPHVPGAYEWYRDAPIIYSLGNLITEHPLPPEDWNLGYFATLDFSLNGSKTCTLSITPYRQTVEDGGVRLLKGEQRAGFLADLEGKRRCLEDEARWIQAWKEYCRENADVYLLRQYAPGLRRGFRVLSKVPGLARAVLWGSNRYDRLNMLRCEAHRDVLEEVMKDLVEIKTQP